jgi:hypothetical protein
LLAAFAIKSAQLRRGAVAGPLLYVPGVVITQLWNRPNSGAQLVVWYEGRVGAMPEDYDAAAEFVRAFPPGTTLTVAQLEAWAETQRDHYIAAALLVLRPMKRYSSLIRLLSRGGASNGLPADQQFKIVVADKQRGLLLVCMDTPSRAPAHQTSSTASRRSRT